MIVVHEIHRIGAVGEMGGRGEGGGGEGGGVWMLVDCSLHQWMLESIARLCFGRIPSLFGYLRLDFSICFFFLRGGGGLNVFESHFWVIFESFLSHFSIILGHFRDFFLFPRFWVICGSFLGHFWVISQLFFSKILSHFRVIFGSYSENVSQILPRILSHFWVIFESLWVIFCLDFFCQNQVIF